MKNFTLFQIVPDQNDTPIFDIVAEDYYKAFEGLKKLFICLEDVCETEMLFQTRFENPVLQITSSNFTNKVQLILVQQSF